MERLVAAGMDVARLNLSHGDLEGHARTAERLREAARRVGRRLALLADLPGPKLRIGRLREEPIELRAGERFTLTTEPLVGDATRAAVSFARLPEVVRRGDTCFLNDGLVRLEVERVEGREVHCRVAAGGELRSGKGLNLPGAELGIEAFTERDRAGLRFAVAHGIDAVSQSFVESAADVAAVRAAARELGGAPFVVAKIERARALAHVPAILDAADGVMVARGDLGVEIPIEEIAAVQKRLVREANLRGRPVITATQMLESMTEHPRPTRAEATDVANAILDGTDAVMLSAESAVGRYPVEAVEMLARIAAVAERQRPAAAVRLLLRGGSPAGTAEQMARSADEMLEHLAPVVALVPTRSGATARRIARFRPAVWIAAISTEESTCQQLMLTAGVRPVHVAVEPDDWRAFARRWMAEQGLAGGRVVLVQGPSPAHPEASHRIEVMELA
jgi:pyruvate kinase